MKFIKLSGGVVETTSPELIKYFSSNPEYKEYEDTKKIVEEKKVEVEPTEFKSTLKSIKNKKQK